MIKVSILLVLALALSTLVIAQTVAGTWRGATGNGTPLILELVVEGDVLTGSLTRGNETTPIRDGTVVKNRIHFAATLGGQTQSFTGELMGEQLIAYLDRAGPEASIAFQRVK